MKVSVAAATAMVEHDDSKKKTANVIAASIKAKIISNPVRDNIV